MLGCNESNIIFQQHLCKLGQLRRSNGRNSQVSQVFERNLWLPHFRTFCELVEGEENKLTTFSTWTIMLGCNESNIIFQQHLCKLGQLRRSNGRNSQVSQVFERNLWLPHFRTFCELVEGEENKLTTLSTWTIMLGYNESNIIFQQHLYKLGQLRRSNGRNSQVIERNLWPPHFRTFCELVEGEENKLTTFSTWTIMLGCNESNIIFQQHLCKLGQLRRSNGRNSQVFERNLWPPHFRTFCELVEGEENKLTTFSTWTIMLGYNESNIKLGQLRRSNGRNSQVSQVFERNLWLPHFRTFCELVEGEENKLTTFSTWAIMLGCNESNIIFQQHLCKLGQLRRSNGRNSQVFERNLWLPHFRTFCELVEGEENKLTTFSTWTIMLGYNESNIKLGQLRRSNGRNSQVSQVFERNLWLPHFRTFCELVEGEENKLTTFSTWAIMLGCNESNIIFQQHLCKLGQLRRSNGRNSQVFERNLWLPHFRTFCELVEGEENKLTTFSTWTIMLGYNESNIKLGQLRRSNGRNSQVSQVFERNLWLPHFRTFCELVEGEENKLTTFSTWAIMLGCNESNIIFQQHLCKLGQLRRSNGRNSQVFERNLWLPHFRTFCELVEGEENKLTTFSTWTIMLGYNESNIKLGQLRRSNGRNSQVSQVFERNLWLPHFRTFCELVEGEENKLTTFSTWAIMLGCNESNIIFQQHLCKLGQLRRSNGRNSQVFERNLWLPHFRTFCELVEGEENKLTTFSTWTIMLGYNESNIKLGQLRRSNGRNSQVSQVFERNLWLPHFRTFCELVEGEENKLTTFSTWAIMLGCNESNIIFQQHLCKLGQLRRSNGRNSQVFERNLWLPHFRTFCELVEGEENKLTTFSTWTIMLGYNESMLIPGHYKETLQGERHCTY